MASNRTRSIEQVLGESSKEPLEPKKRRKISNEQRKALREYRQNSNPRTSYKELIKWFSQRYDGHALGTSTVGEILSIKFDYLDTTTNQCDIKRNTDRGERWPELEEILRGWTQRYLAAKNTLSSAVLKAQAETFWNALDVYKNKPMPHFSEQWLSNFKARNAIEQTVRHGETALAVIDEAAQEQIAKIRAAAATYPAADVLSKDATSFFWKLHADRSVRYERAAGLKKVRTRITVALTCDATRHKRLPLWTIGNAKPPNCLRAEGIHHLEGLGAVWRSNHTAWKNWHVMKEYLIWLDKLVAPKRILLLMDNFSAHELGYTKVTEERPLKYVTVKYFPANTTSHFQPLDQRSISTRKTHVKDKMTKFMPESFNNGKNVRPEMHVSEAVEWAIDAWQNNVISRTINNCWSRSTCVDYGSAPANSLDTNDTYGIAVQFPERIQNLVNGGRISKAMDINLFFNPADRMAIDEPLDKITSPIVAQYNGSDIESEESKGERDEQNQITHKEAILLLEKLQLYETQMDEYADRKMPAQLLKYHQLIKSREAASKIRHTVLDSWVTGGVGNVG